jgi:hypothetical protein
MTAVRQRSAADQAAGTDEVPVGASRRSRPYDWFAFFVGLLLVASPLVLSAPDDQGIGAGNLAIMGLTVMGCALAARAGRDDRWHWRMLVATCGLWLMCTPLVWGYVDKQYTMTALAGGALIFAAMLKPLTGAFRDGLANARAEAEARGRNDS